MNFQCSNSLKWYHYAVTLDKAHVSNATSSSVKYERWTAELKMTISDPKSHRCMILNTKVYWIY